MSAAPLKNEFKAGIFIVLCLLIFSISIWMLGQERQIFSSQEEYYANFSDVKGLNPGAAVRIGGITIGRVNSVGLIGEGRDAAVQVSILVNEDFTDRVRTDTVATLATQGLLGDRFINLSIGKEKEVASPGSLLATRSIGELSDYAGKAGTVLENAVETSENLKELVADLRGAALDDLSSSIKNMNEITNALVQRKGALGKLIFAKDGDDSIIKTLEEIAADIKGITSSIKNGNGALHSLIYDEEGKELISSLRKASDGIASASTGLSELSTQIKEGDGLANDLIYGESPEGFNEIITKLNETADNLKIASANLANGGGTLGALLVDAQLYDKLVEVTDGANRSIILRHAIRSSLEKEKDSEEEPKAQLGTPKSLDETSLD